MVLSGIKIPVRTGLSKVTLYFQRTIGKVILAIAVIRLGIKISFYQYIICLFVHLEITAIIDVVTIFILFFTLYDIVAIHCHSTVINVQKTAFLPIISYDSQFTAVQYNIAVLIQFSVHRERMSVQMSAAVLIKTQYLRVGCNAVDSGCLQFHFRMGAFKLIKSRIVRIIKDNCLLFIARKDGLMVPSGIKIPVRTGLSKVTLYF